MVSQQTINLTLEELAKEVAHSLEYYSLLGASSDSRVSPLPDARTIRYYTTLGLLDRPKMEGRQARYGKRQLLQLLAIKALQAHGSPLSEVQARLFGLADAELEQLLASLSHGIKTRRDEAIRPVIWQEFVIAPGVKILVEEGWSPENGVEGLTEKIKGVLELLRLAPKASNGGDNG